MITINSVADSHLVAKQNDTMNQSNVADNNKSVNATDNNSDNQVVTVSTLKVQARKQISNKEEVVSSKGENELAKVSSNEQTNKEQQNKQQVESQPVREQVREQVETQQVETQQVKQPVEVNEKSETQQVKEQSETQQVVNQEKTEPVAKQQATSEIKVGAEKKAEPISLVKFNDDGQTYSTGITNNTPGSTQGSTIQTDIPKINGKPAFCLQYHYNNPGNTNYNITDNTFSKSVQNQIYTVVNYGGDNGQPILGLTNSNYVNLAKQLAVWDIVSANTGSNYEGDYMKVNLNDCKPNDANGAKILSAAKQLVAIAQKAPIPAQASISNVQVQSGTSFNNGNEQSGTVTYETNLGKNVKVNLVGAPEGAKVIDLQTTDKGGSFKVEVNGQKYTGPIKFTITGSQDLHKMNVYKPENAYKVQYMIGFSNEPNTASVSGQVNMEAKPQPKKGNLVVQVINRDDNKVIDQLGYTKSGDVGSSMGAEGIQVPEGYHIQQVLINGKIATQQQIKELLGTGSGTNLSPSQIQGLAMAVTGNSDIPTTYTDGTTKIVYYLDKNHPEHPDASNKISDVMITKEGKIVVPMKVEINEKDGAPVDYKELTAPEGWKIVGIKELKVQNDGKTQLVDNFNPKNLPSTMQDYDTVIQYIIEKVPAPVVKHENDIKTVNSKGETVSPKVTVTGTPGEKEPLTPVVPKGYHITKITDNGKVIPESEIPQVIGKEDNHVVVHVAKDAPAKSTIKITVNQIDKDGKVTKVILPTNTQEGTDGSKYTPPAYTIPSGDKVVSVTVDGKKVASVNDIPKDFDGKNHDIVIDVTPAPVVKHENDIETVNSKGEVISPKVTVEGTPGEPKKLTPVVPKGYHITKITCNGKEIPESEIPQVIGDKDNHVIVHVAKDKGSLDVKVITTDGKVISNKAFDGNIGDKNNYMPEIPEGYKVVKILQNGKIVTSADNILTNPQDKITYVIAKIPTKVINHTETKTVVVNHDIPVQQPAPAPVVEKVPVPTPVVEQPAPAPAPVVEQPAPVAKATLIHTGTNPDNSRDEEEVAIISGAVILEEVLRRTLKK